MPLTQAYYNKSKADFELNTCDVCERESGVYNLITAFT